MSRHNGGHYRRRARSNPLIVHFDLAARIVMVTDYDGEDLRVAARVLPASVFNEFDDIGCS
jgi:hypothetical protein